MIDPDAIPIYAGQDFYVPYFEVRLQGRPIKQDVVHDIIQVVYKDSLIEVDHFELTINNWDAEKRTFKYIDEDLFDPGKQVELWMGYFGRDSLRRMLTGEITSLKPTFPAAGQPTLAITGLNLLHRLQGGGQSHVYEDMTDTQMAQAVARRLNITPPPNAAGSEEQYPYILQDNEPDLVFLMTRARRIGYDLFMDEDAQGGQEPQLYFGPSQRIRQATYQLTYGRSLIEFTPNLDTSRQVGAVTVQGWDPVRREAITYTAQRTQADVQGVGDDGGQGAINQSAQNRIEVITNRPVNSLDEARTLATETLNTIVKNMLKGSGSTVGLPDLRAGSVVQIDGLGRRFSGRYFITATTHTIGDSGYTTQFDCRREEL
jgi:phage protein D